MTKELRTEKELVRDLRDAEICRVYKEMREAMPLATRNRILAYLAEKYDLVRMTIKVILKKNNCYI